MANDSSARQKKQGGAKKLCSIEWNDETFEPIVYMCDRQGKPVRADAGSGLDEINRLACEVPKQDSSEKYGQMIKDKIEAGGEWQVINNVYVPGKEGGKSLKEAERGAGMTADQIRERLREGVHTIKYRKVGKPAKLNRRTGEMTPATPGEEVERFATLDQRLIRATLGDMARHEARNGIPSPTVVTYFDIYAENKRVPNVTGDFRCFRLENFLGFQD